MTDNLISFLLSPTAFTLILLGVVLLGLAVLATSAVLAHRRYTRANRPWGRMAQRAKEFGHQLLADSRLLSNGAAGPNANS